MTQGRFSDLRQLATAILRDAAAPGEATLAQDGCVTRFALRVEVNGASKDQAEDGAVDALLADLETYRVVLTGGRFISADGFKILDDAVAVPDAGKTAPDGTLTLALAWAAEGCMAK
jgi:hypothetical protein